MIPPTPSTVTDAQVELAAKNIARMVPLDDGSRWNPGYGENFPGEYSEAERKLIRSIARAALCATPPAQGE